MDPKKDENPPVDTKKDEKPRQNSKTDENPTQDLKKDEKPRQNSKTEEKPSQDPKKDEKSPPGPKKDDKPTTDAKVEPPPSSNDPKQNGDAVPDPGGDVDKNTTEGEGEEKEPSVDADATLLYEDWESRKEPGADREEKILAKAAETKRDKWKNSLEFIMSSISSAVGLGNIWRFSRTALDNGGGAFLIPYLILVVVVARPMYYLEVAAGQFSSRGAVGIWDMVPVFRGVGYAMAFLSAITVTYYCAILSFCGAYLIFGMANPLPWANCDKTKYVPREFYLEHNMTCNYSAPEKKMVGRFMGRTFDNESINVVNAEMFFQLKVAQKYDNIDYGIGFPLWHLAVPLLFIWILIFLSVIFGTKSSGKTAYFTAIFPYLVLFTFLGRACSLKGAGDGVRYFFQPNWEKIGTINVWVNALNQCLFSLGIGYGQVVAYGSFNGFRQKLSRDAFIVSCMDTFTSLLAGVTVFATLGVLAKAKGLDVSKVSNDGFSLLFVSYPEVLLHFGSMPFPQIFSFLFFAMLVTLGVGSATGYFYTVRIIILDTFPRINTKKWYGIFLTFCLALSFFLLGLPMTTPGGIYVITLLDQYAGAFICYLVVVMEVIGIAWVYGMKSFMKDVCFMTNGKMTGFTAISMMAWGYAVPVILIGVIIAVMYDFKNPTEKVNDKNVKFPVLVLIIGTILPILMALLIPSWAVYIFFTRKTKSWYKKYMASRSPNSKWGPKDPIDRQQWIEYKQDFDDRCWLYKNTISRLKCRCCTKPKSESQATIFQVPPEPVKDKEEKIEMMGDEKQNTSAIT